MKTIKDKNGKIERVSDAEAHAKVGGFWSYCSKQEWKDATRPKNIDTELSIKPTKKKKEKAK